MSFDFKHDKNKKIHFIGIGGISMSGLAEILISNKYKISGSDMKSSHITEKLANQGVQIYIGHSASNIHNVDLIIYTAAISKDNPELIAATEQNINTMDRAEFLGIIMKGHKYNVAISGTHGKTTTTSMFSQIILKADLDPTILVGGELDAINGNVRVGGSEYFITEACEYKASFLKFFPYIGIICNIDADHLDFYKDINEIEKAFRTFAKLIPSDGFLVANAEDKRVLEVSSGLPCNVLTFGIDSGDVRAQNIVFDNNGCSSFDVFKASIKLFNVKLNVPGRYNILNALAAISTGLCLNISSEFIKAGLSDFNGTHRRFEIKGQKNGITVIDDYAHHPTEIKAVLEACKHFPHNRIICVFQPHTYSRTITLFKEFSTAFFNVDKLILADIYAAREKDNGEISSVILGDSIRRNGVDCTNFHYFKDIVTYLQDELKTGDVLLTVGAGDIYEVGEMFLKLQ